MKRKPQRKKSIKFCKGMTFITLPSRTDAAYMKMRVFAGNKPNKIDTAIPFHRGNYDEQFEIWLVLAKEKLQYPRIPPMWRKQKPAFDSLLKAFQLNETAHYRYTAPKE